MSPSSRTCVRMRQRLRKGGFGALRYSRDDGDSGSSSCSQEPYGVKIGYIRRHPEPQSGPPAAKPGATMKKTKLPAAAVPLCMCSPRSNKDEISNATFARLRPWESSPVVWPHRQLQCWQQNKGANDGSYLADNRVPAKGTQTSVY